MNDNTNQSCNCETKKELPDQNIEHDFQTEKVEQEKSNPSNCQSCNDLKNKI